MRRFRSSQRTMQHQMSQSRVKLNRWRASERFEGKTAPGLLVVQTFAVDGPVGTGIDRYEIQLAPDRDADAKRLIVQIPRRQQDLERQQALYDQAVRLEGADTRCDVTYHRSQKPDGTHCLVLDSITERK